MFPARRSSRSVRLRPRRRRHAPPASVLGRLRRALHRRRRLPAVLAVAIAASGVWPAPPAGAQPSQAAPPP
ncbi:MAG TPA: hypothetical protein VKD21_01720, partial [Acidimicrobiales bacterium]|nr:hypothetical protein [Acidimicrobiales bacterium]